MSTTVLVSGGMDPLHVGHIKLLRDASLCGKVIVALNSDEWLIRKKGYCFMPWEERAEILMAILYVRDVIRVDDSDDTVCDALHRLDPDYFGNGGDRAEDNTPEKQLCEELGIKMLWGLGGGKIQSSSELVERITEL